jgi:hypothetical protein
MRYGQLYKYIVTRKNENEEGIMRKLFKENGGHKIDGKQPYPNQKERRKER